MATTEKVSVAIGREELRLARRAAEAAGMSLSAFVTSAVRSRVAEQRRLEAARQLLATFDPEDFATPEREAELLALWSRPRTKPPTKRRSKRS